MCAFLVLLLLVLPATAQPQFTWTTNSEGASVTITGYTGPGGAVIIPNSINNLLVTAIGERAFEPGSPELGFFGKVWFFGKVCTFYRMG
jgi:hypothetical protein